MREVQRFLSRICAHKVKRVLRLEMELTLILLITLIWLSVYKKNIFLTLLFKIHKEKIKKKKHELTACQNTVEPRYNKPL